MLHCYNNCKPAVSVEDRKPSSSLPYFESWPHRTNEAHVNALTHNLTHHRTKASEHREPRLRRAQQSAHSDGCLSVGPDCTLLYRLQRATAPPHLAVPSRAPGCGACCYCMHVFCAWCGWRGGGQPLQLQIPSEILFGPPTSTACFSHIFTLESRSNWPLAK